MSLLKLYMSWSEYPVLAILNITPLELSNISRDKSKLIKCFYSLS